MDADSLSPEQLAPLLPLAAAWAEQQEACILANGAPLTAPQLEDARAVGVAHPGRVRLLSVAAIPTPEHPALRAAAEATGLLGPGTAGLALRYGIYLRRDVAGDQILVAHELVHTAQYERFGSITAFLSAYLGECLGYGYPTAPLEQEALRVSERLRRPLLRQSSPSS